MKKSVFVLFAFVCCIVASCDKLPANGALDGQWQLVEKEEHGAKTDLKGKRLYCSFQLKVHMFGSRELGIRKYFSYFEHKGNKLRFHTFTHRSKYLEDNNVDKLITPEETDLIAPWGYYAVDCSFDVVELNNNTMVLEANGTKIRYRKL